MNIALSPDPQGAVVTPGPSPVTAPGWVTAKTLVYRPGPDFDLVIPHLSLRAGRKTAIIGGNGSGKTTLLRLLLGHITPDEGTVGFSGPAKGLMALEQRHTIGVQLQDAGFNPVYRVADILRLNETARGAIDPSILEAFGVSEIARRRFGALSSGQKQRLQLALALGHAPRFAIFDEPTSNLDPAYEAAFGDVLADLSKRDPAFTAVFITHAANVVAQCDDILLLARGRIDAHDALDTVIDTRFGTRAALFQAGEDTLDQISTLLPTTRMHRRQGILRAFGGGDLTLTATQLAAQHDLTRFSTWHTGASDILESLKHD